MNPTIPSRRLRSRGFTLAELMVAMAVFTIILLLTAEVSNSALTFTRTTSARLTAQREASVAARQLQSDFAQRIQRLDTPVRFEKNPGNDSLVVLTKRLGYSDRTDSPDRAVSITAYRVETDAPNDLANGLLRASSGIGFGDLAERPSLEKGTLSLATLPGEGPATPEAGGFQMLAPGVIRLELSFLVNDQEQPIRKEAPDDQDIIDGVIATVCVLDPERRAVLGADQLTRIAEQFEDSTNGRLPVGDWLQTLDMLTSRLPDVPKSTLHHVRVRQILIPFHDRL